MNKTRLLQRIRIVIALFVLLLVLSGITAFPIYLELKWIIEHRLFSPGSAMGIWLAQVYEAVSFMRQEVPFLFYGYDWLAFAHIVIGLAFIGPYRDPVRNKWVIDWGIMACILVVPLAAIAGYVRCIPWFHILIDCAFGIIGIIPLLIVKSWIKKLEILPVE